ncbi:uncharacterized protein METZ01_LOCUS172761 [marine metagenome]|uniref:Homoserine kinase n=1 Tax=marine metagenome TaxID=408172 RepID=A0A382C397_9ZZZZ
MLEFSVNTKAEPSILCVRAFAPATVGNVICGFDVFGLAMETPGDEVEVRHGSDPGVVITAVHGDDGRIPTEPDRNVASVAAKAVLMESSMGDLGLEIEIWKGLPLAGGMGGSAASSVAAAVATDALLGTGLTKEALLQCALKGEQRATGSAHPDNVAPALHGGLVMVRPDSPAVAIDLPVPKGLTIALIHPHLELETKAMREVLSTDVPLNLAVAQWADCAALVVGLYEKDWDLISRALVDRIAQPTRSSFIPGFTEVRAAAIEAGAVGAGLSGSGPSVFGLCRSRRDAEVVANAMTQAFASAGLDRIDSYVSPVDSRGARIVGGTA